MALWRAACVYLVSAAVVGMVAACGGASRSDHRATGFEQATARPSGTLYLSSTQFGPRTVTVIDAATGRLGVRRLKELSPGDAPFGIAVIGGQLVVYGHVATYAFGARVREPGRVVGASWFFIPSAFPGRVWLVSLDPRDPAQTHGPGTVREVTVGGRVILASTARPPSAPLAAVDGGLLVQARTLEVWQPVSGRIVRRLPGLLPLAARHSLVVSCGSGCPVLHLANAATGRDVQVPPGRGFRFVESYNGAFSPHGSLVAVPVTTTAGDSRVAVVDIARRTATLVPGARLARDYTLLAWASTGWLYYNAGNGHLAAYHPGRARATLLPLHVQPFQRLVAR